MLLRTRMVLIFAAATLLLTGAVAVPLWTIQGLSEADLLAARQEAQDSAWTAAVADAATPMEIGWAQMAADPALLAAAASEDVPALRRMLADATRRADLVRADLVAPEGRLIASSRGLAADAPMMDGAAIGGRLAGDPWIEGVEIVDGRLLLIIAATFPGGRVLELASPVEPVLQALSRAGERALFVVDPADRLLVASDPEEWPLIAGARAGQPGGAVTVMRARRTLSAVSTPLAGLAGQRIGTMVMVRDVTAAAQRRALVLLTTGSAAALVFAAVGFVLYGVAKAALDPLSEVTRVIRAMAGGDAMVDADIPDRRDEVGAIAGAVEVFRRDIVALARTRTRDALREAQQQALIRREMQDLATMLDEAERAEVQADLRSSLGAGGNAALAEAFRRMAARVTAQHRRLADLLAERTRDLEIVRQALAERAQLSRLRQELEVARHLQLSSLPQVFPPFPGRTDFELFAAIEPAKEVGGDFYDFALLDGDRLALMIGDASGKGVSAALFIAMARSMLRSALVRGSSPAQALALANATLAVENHTMMFATAFLGVLDLASGRLTWAIAGHNPPYVLRAGQPPRALQGEPGIALGVVEDAEYMNETLDLPRGATLVLFTDGVTEAAATDLSLFEERRLEAALDDLADAGPELTVTTIQDRVRAFSAGAEQADDITVLAARWLGPASGRPASPLLTAATRPGGPDGA